MLGVTFQLIWLIMIGSERSFGEWYLRQSIYSEVDKKIGHVKGKGRQKNTYSYPPANDTPPPNDTLL